MSFRLFRSVFASPSFPILDPTGIELAADNVISHTRQVFDSAAADEHDRVFLQIVSNARNIGYDFMAVGQSNLGNLSDGRVGLLWRNSVNLCANSSLERRTFGQIHRPVCEQIKSLVQGLRSGLGLLLLPRSFYELVDCGRHTR